MRIVIPSIQTPFIHGGATLMVNGLVKHLQLCGHEVDKVSLPFKFFPNDEIIDLMDYIKKLDFSSFSGYHIDKIIALQFPMYYVNHPNKILWLMHQHRSVYELFNSDSADISLVKLRETIHKNDSSILSSYNKRFSMCENVSRRLLKCNNISSIPVYHPPFNAEKFFCDDDLGYIFCPSRLETLKRQDLLIKAMKFVKTPVKAIIAGDGGQKDNYQKLICELRVENKVRLIGGISEAEKYVYYARSLAVFFGPYDEDYGYITLEAMLSSKPVITCYDSGGPLEFISENNGFIVNPDPQEIAERIDELFLQRNLARKLGINANLSYKDKKICWDNVVNKLLME